MLQGALLIVDLWKSWVFNLAKTTVHTRSEIVVCSGWAIKKVYTNTKSFQYLNLGDKTFWCCRLKRLTLFFSMFPFNLPWKNQKIIGFLMFSGVSKREHWKEMCKINQIVEIVEISKKIKIHTDVSQFFGICSFRNYIWKSLVSSTHFEQIFYVVPLQQIFVKCR